MNKTSEFFLHEKDVKISKQSHAYRDYVSTCNVDTLYSFSHELEELINFFFELRAFKLVITLVLEFEKIEKDDETKYTIFYSNSNAETTINEGDINDILE